MYINKVTVRKANNVCYSKIFLQTCSAEIPYSHCVKRILHVVLETTSCVLLLGPSLQERHRGPGACSEGSGAQVLWGAAERAGIAQSGEDEAQGRPELSTTT